MSHYQKNFDQTIKEFVNLKEFDNIHQRLNEYRKDTHSQNAVLRALTTRNINENKARALNEALVYLEKCCTVNAVNAQKAPNIPWDQIIQLIIEVLKIILKLIQDSGACNKKAMHAELVNAIKSSQNNPFLNLSKADLAKTDLSRTRLKYANFQSANLRDCQFKDADLSEANFTEANLAGANFSGAKLDHANFSWTDLSKVKMDPLPSLTLRQFLQVNFPANIQLEKVPTLAEIQKALIDIEQSLTNEKLKHGLQYYKKMVAHNLVKIAERLKDENEKKIFLQTLQNDLFFTEKKGAAFRKNMNDMLVSVAGFFGRKDAAVIVPQPGARVLRDALREHSKAKVEMKLAH